MSTKARWSDDDIATLRRLYAEVTGEEMAEALGRTRNAVQRMACLLRLRRRAVGRSTPRIRAAGQRRRGRGFSPEHLQSLRVAGERRKGRPITDEHREALRAAAKRRRELERQTQL